MSSQTIVPVLFLIYNRPEHTQRVFAEIRNAKPIRLYIAADGPRPTRSKDFKLCEQARAVVDQIDWECEVFRLYRDTNLGCKLGVSSAISWFFDQEQEGIILEDDCLPDSSFFRFSSELLDHYRREPRVMMISGTNDLGIWNDEHESYHFSLGGIWGWASWSRAWKHFDESMSEWNTPTSARVLNSAFGNHREYQKNTLLFESAFRGRIDTWDIQWKFARLIHRGLTVTPARNLVSNIGFGPEGTHTRRRRAFSIEPPVYSMKFPLRHPVAVEVDREYVRRSFARTNPRLFRRLTSRLCVLMDLAVWKTNSIIPPIS